MAVINVAYTAPVNPPGTTAPLTAPQIWEGLKDKVRHAEKFVPIITACEVLLETGDGDDTAGHTVKRAVTFRPGAAGPGGGTAGGRVVEVCKLYAPCRIDFEQEDGTRVGNYVSEGPDGELYMTYVFQWKVDGVATGSVEAGELAAKYKKVSFLPCLAVVVEFAWGVGRLLTE